MQRQFNPQYVKPNTYWYTLQTGEDHVTHITINDVKTGRIKKFALAGVEPGSFRENRLNEHMMSLTGANIEMWFKESK